jgi:predicted AAA+ superfamily ATPase
MGLAEKGDAVLQRKAMEQLINWHATKHYRALLVSGARQVGKTYLIEQFAHAHYEHFIEINLLDEPEAREAFNVATSSSDLFMRLSGYVGAELVPDETLIFIDEVQESKEVVTFIKFLVQRDDFDYILSGSLLGVELKNIKSVPVGYLDMVSMYPLDFEEYTWANGITAAHWTLLKDAFASRTPVPDYLHKRMLQLYHQYLLVGGMPDAVNAFLDSQNIQAVRKVQNVIISQYRADAAKYNPQNQIALNRIYDLIPSELNNQNKRFVFSNIEKNGRLSRFENDFLWLVEAGIALSVYNVKDLRYPLMLNMDSTLFKLFLSDVGLLTHSIGVNATREMLAGRTDVNFGSLYENAVAQELHAHGFAPYYFKNKHLGELDFVVEIDDRIVPVEVKSGKDYTRHSALNNALHGEGHSIEQAYVLCEGELRAVGAVTYLPIYMVSLLQNGKSS